jgi:hypothetical protein
MILTEDLSAILDDRYSRVIALPPVLPCIDIVNLDLKAAANAQQQVFDQLLAKMATLPAIDIESLHVSLRTDGVKRRRQISWRNRRRLTSTPATSPEIAASAAPESPRARA